MTGFQPTVKRVDLTSRAVRPGDRIGVTFHLHNCGTAPAELAYECLVRFEHATEQFSFDDRHTPRHPTDAWGGDTTVIEGPHAYRVPHNAPEGTYRVKISLYEPYSLNAKPPFWTAVAGEIAVSSSAPPSALPPTPLPAAEVARRKARLAARVSEPAVLETEAFRFTMDRASGSYELLDLSTGVTWASNPFGPGFALLYLRGPRQAAHVTADHFRHVAVRPDAIEVTFVPLVNGCELDITVRFHVSVASPRSLRFSYTAEGRGDWSVAGVRLLDHALWTTDADDGYVAVPHRLGILMRADWDWPQVRQFTNFTVHKEGYSMSFAGVVKDGAAVLATWEDPHTRLEVLHARVDEPLVGGGDLLAPSLVLSKTSRSCTLHVLGRGGYADIAKAYRAVAQERGLVVPWHEKRRRFPSVDHLSGAADFKPFVLRRLVPGTFRNPTDKEVVKVPYTADEVAQLAEHWRHDLDIDRALVVLAGWIHKGYDNQHPDILPAAPEIGGNKGLAEAGERIKRCGYLFGLHDNYQDMYRDAPSWSEDCLVYLPDGSPMKGGVWYGGQAYHMVSNKALALARRPQNLPGVKRCFEPTAYFIDTTLASPLFESWEPNPQTKVEDMQWRKELIDYAKSLFGVFGSEEGVEWGVPHADYFEGMLSHKTRTPVEEPIVPLFPMVFGDCVHLLPHQSDRLRRDHAKQVLDHILYAGLPVYDFGEHLYYLRDEAPGTHVFDRGDQGWTEGLHPTDRFIKNTYEVLSHLNRVTADVPMTHHEGLVPKGRVQLARFGPVEVVVNYGPGTYCHAGTVLPPYGFIIQGPTFLAFYALRHAGVDYPDGALFTARSLDGSPLAALKAMRVYHGFGNPCLYLAGRRLVVEKEEVFIDGHKHHVHRHQRG